MKHEDKHQSALNLWSEKMIDDICYCKYLYTNATLSFSSIRCNNEWRYQLTQWYFSDIALNILNATQLEARESYSSRHVIKSWVTTELSACHKHISHRFTMVILVIFRTFNMSWTHQPLVYYCHISHSQNFQHFMNSSIIGLPLSYQLFT